MAAKGHPRPSQPVANWQVSYSAAAEAQTSDSQTTDRRDWPAPDIASPINQSSRSGGERTGFPATVAAAPALHHASHRFLRL